jgi:oligopeptide transport system substrate-binding protein
VTKKSIVLGTIACYFDRERDIMTVLSPRLVGYAIVFALSAISLSCTAAGGNDLFFGKTTPPKENILRYVSGSEPETLDPQIPDGQNEARLCLALYEGLVEYDPKSGQPIPALAERWDVNKDWSELVFHLRQDGRFSNGDPITARDFVYTIRRGLNSELAGRNASQAYPIKYAQAYNSGGVFVFDSQSGSYLLERDVADKKTDSPPANENEPLSSQPIKSIADEYPSTAEQKTPVADTPFHQLMHSPARLVLPKAEKARQQLLDANPKLRTAVAGKQLVPVKAEDVGVEAVDDYTLRISLNNSAPYFLELMPHQFFRVLHQKTVEKFGSSWTEPANIVSSGPFKLESWKHYDRIVMVRDPNYRDAGHVMLDKIVFYLITDNTTMLGLYKAGELDATYNHTVPAAWLDVISSKKDFMDTSEAGIEYYRFNTTKGPTADVRVRKALNMALDKKAVADWRRVKELTSFTPAGIFPNYPQPPGDAFDVAKAKQLLAEAGYHDANGNFDPQKFEASEIELIANTDGNNVPFAEFILAQWKQNLGVAIQLRIMEGKTFFKAQSELDYKGISRTGFVADYLDPYTFLGIFYTPTGINGTGWWDPKYVELLDEANRTIDHDKRYEILAQAEKLLLDAQPVLPIVVSTTRWMKKPYVKGMYPNALTLHAWKFVYIERDPAKWDYGVPDMKP